MTDTTVTVDALDDLGNIADGDKFVGERVAGQTREITYRYQLMTGTTNVLTVVDGGNGGYTYNISSNYVGQTSITTLGTVTIGTWHGTLIGVAYGGLGADLSATGGTSEVLKQTSIGGAITVGQLAASDLSNGTSGSGPVALASGPTFTAPVLGTPASGALSNCTGYPLAQLTGAGTGVLTALAINTGSAGAPVLFNGALGTPSSGALSSCTGYLLAQLTGAGTGVLTALAVNIGSAGAFITFNGALGTPSSGTLTNCSGLPVGGISASGTPSSSTFLRGDGSWSTPSGGKVIQIVTTSTSAVATGSTVLPLDDTIPQNTEGDQYLTLAITPTSVSNKIKVEFSAFAADSVIAWITVALYRDSVANALGATAVYSGTANAGIHTILDFIETAPSTSAITYKIRIGTSSAGTITLNGSAGGRFFGGVAAATLTITEYAP